MACGVGSSNSLSTRRSVLRGAAVVSSRRADVITSETRHTRGMDRPARSGVALQVVNLRRSWGSVCALDGLSLDIAAGELVALLGPSGCGKSTALRIIAGLDEADSGQVLVEGTDIARLPANQRDMGMVFQAYSLFPNMTARDNVAFGLRVRRVGAKVRRRRVDELLELVGLSSQARQFPHQMSGGQQQRVALARALAIGPRVLLALLGCADTGSMLCG